MSAIRGGTGERQARARKMDGGRRRCGWVGVPADGHDYEVAYRYLRWCKRNVQPRADKR